MEIRLHGRGGQGGVSCAKILAVLYARLGKHVQAFGDYGGERTGAPVRAYLRVDDRPVQSRNKVLRPDHLLVLDPTLLDADTVSGLAAGGLLLVNSPEPPSAFGARVAGYRWATVDATAIARRHAIGSRSVVIVNTTMVGAVARLLAIPFDAVAAVYAELGHGHDLEAAREAFAEVRAEEPIARTPERGDGSGTPSTAHATARATTGGAPAWAQAPGGRVLDVTELEEGRASSLQTGGWRSQRPEYCRVLAPCSAACPAGTDVVGFVQALERGAELEAAEILARTMPLPAVCGRVCPGFCMQRCNRGALDGAVEIRALERWLGDQVALPVPVIEHPRQVRQLCVVGGGPAGLSAATLLRHAGHEVTLLEAEPELGGVLAWGIPRFRLPRAALDRDIERVLALGVRACVGQRVDAERLGLLRQQVDGVIVATGLQRAVALPVPGSELCGVEQGLAFLRRASREPRTPLAGHVVVLGGGNTALDCARTALRLGAEHVTIAYRRTRVEMPGLPEEIEQALDEGIELLVQRAAVGFVGREQVQAIALCEVELGPLDASGRRRPLATERVREVACRHVLLALGQLPDHAPLPAGWRLAGNRLWCSAEPLPVFVAGDFASAEGTVAHAIGDGQRAARLLLRALGADLQPFERAVPAEALGPEGVRLDRFERQPPAELGLEPVERRVRSFDEVARGLESTREADRCLGCGSCSECDRCLGYCPDGIIRRDPAARYRIDYDYCKGCGLCVAECPRAAMRMVGA